MSNCPNGYQWCNSGRPHYHRNPEGNGKVLGWIIGIIFFVLLLFWPAMAFKGMQALYVELGWLASITVIIVAAILTRANSPEIRDKEKNELRLSG